MKKAGILYPAKVYVEHKGSKLWSYRGTYDTVVKLDSDLDVDDPDFVKRRAMLELGATNKNIDKYRVSKIVVDYDTPLCRKEFLDN